ncbi:peptidyl-prolyl cis-trans isomerase FKBP53-like [Zingiber officinale]|uniref:peptidyl-prolyl cis-trans isomerase FKBP53-like n=1 Tax=Zingiber officinale TaxID=94328 RepID=UPI001C4A7E27|nr:peptidyl-prolyl cis-trans isomerase FKBP53-like [Zingiber officinale]
MAFWGVEVKPGKPYTHVHDQARGRLRIGQATLGNGKATTKSVVQCNVGKKSPVLLCSLIPDKTEACPLELEFEEEGEVVFSVIGPRSVHLSGYYIGSGRSGRDGGDDTDSYGEDIGVDDSESYEEFDSDEDEYESDFIDDGDIDMFPLSPRHKNNVVIEEIVDDEKPTNRNNTRRRLKKKSQVSDTDNEDDNSQLQLIVEPKNTAVVESEDEDGFPISSLLRKNVNKNEPGDEKTDKKTVDEDKKRKIDAISQETEPSRGVAGVEQNHVLGDNVETHVGEGKRKKKKEKTVKEYKELAEEAIKGDVNAIPNANGVDQNHPSEAEKPLNENDRSSGGKKKKNRKKKVKEETAHEKVGEETGLNETEMNQDTTEVKLGSDSAEVEQSVREALNDEVPDDKSLLQKAKKKKKAKKGSNPQNDSNVKEPVIPPEEHNHEHKTRTFSNGLSVEELSMGKPDGKKASPGSKVLVNYVGKLKNGKIFDSNVGTRPFKFRLGVGHVIKGWDVGIAGMRIGDKRRLNIPPSMGYGNKNVGKIPANSWLYFDVEMVDVK